jgi:hypothetical protein
MLSFLPAARLQEFDNYGQILVGGKIYTYMLGTTTPKAAYKDVNGNAAHENPIILDSVGSEEIYLNGSYTLWIYDANGVQVGPPVDILGGINDFITTSASGPYTTNAVVSVNNYDAVRALSTSYAWVFVQGRNYNADGGEGLFFLDLIETAPDDDGTILTPNVTGRYVRYNYNTIDPRWFGLHYESILDQSQYLSASEVACIRDGKPIEIVGETYINQNFTTRDLTEWIFSDTASFRSALGVDFIF